ncbi:hypothetical protein [Facklamia hominis]|uniref:hypothetical protein n=1 Tax=Facklamia hominis TaxID=178214 RepID=UPI00101DFE91|nr:hypothetical protein [Facklamia hominis]RYC98131.1 hypothetical protein EKN08_04950 [Facklamia hominis]
MFALLKSKFSKLKNKDKVSKAFKKVFMEFDSEHFAKFYIVSFIFCLLTWKGIDSPAALVVFVLNALLFPIAVRLYQMIEYYLLGHFKNVFGEGFSNSLLWAIMVRFPLVYFIVKCILIFLIWVTSFFVGFIVIILLMLKHLD